MTNPLAVYTRPSPTPCILPASASYPRVQLFVRASSCTHTGAVPCIAQAGVILTVRKELGLGSSSSVGVGLTMASILMQSTILYISGRLTTNKAGKMNAFQVCARQRVLGYAR